MWEILIQNYDFHVLIYSYIENITFYKIILFLKGSACTALIVAVLAKKLELTKAEQHVIYFILNNKIKNKVGISYDKRKK